MSQQLLADHAFYRALDAYDGRLLRGEQQSRPPAQKGGSGRVYLAGDQQQQQLRWTIWGGLYFSGTVYTTIGLHDHNRLHDHTIFDFMCFIIIITL
jgi:hypothetical protein